jgi:hypothetical protein
MKKCLKLIHVFLVLSCATAFLCNSEVCKAKEFDASINVMAYDRNVSIKINGVHLRSPWIPVIINCLSLNI